MKLRAYFQYNKHRSSIFVEDNRNSMIIIHCFSCMMVDVLHILFQLAQIQSNVVKGSMG